MHRFVELLADRSPSESRGIGSLPTAELVPPSGRPGKVIVPFGVFVVEQIHVPGRTATFTDDAVSEGITRESGTSGVGTSLRFNYPTNRRLLFQKRL